MVVGGQFAGRRASRLLRRGGEFDVTLVDAKGFWEYTPGVLRCLVEPAAAQRMVLPQLRGTVCATVVGLETSEGGKSATGVRLNDGSTLPADHVVLATGSTYTHPVKAAHDIASTPEVRREQIRAAHSTLASAAGVVIVGGGTVGVELAAEIAGTWGRHKVVTIVTPGDRLLERMPPRAGRLAQRWLEQKGVWVILNDRIEDWNGAPRDSAIPRPDGREWCLRTEQGRELRASLVYPCVGGQPSAPLNANHRNLRGAINVDDELRVEGFDNVYGAGDCASTKEEKNALCGSQRHRCRAKHPSKTGAQTSARIPEVRVRLGLGASHRRRQFAQVERGDAVQRFGPWRRVPSVRQVVHRGNANQLGCGSSRGDCAVGRSGGSERVLGSESTVLIVRAHDAK